MYHLEHNIIRSLAFVVREHLLCQLLKEYAAMVLIEDASRDYVTLSLDVV